MKRNHWRTNVEAIGSTRRYTHKGYKYIVKYISPYEVKVYNAKSIYLFTLGHHERINRVKIITSIDMYKKER